jgi:aryl-alcohol dehydrogenase-like predicted oxidoreductase
MHYRTFQNQNISEIGLGTWQLGNADWGVINDEEAFAIFNAFTGAGGNFIDMAELFLIFNF